MIEIIPTVASVGAVGAIATALWAGSFLAKERRAKQIAAAKEAADDAARIRAENEQKEEERERQEQEVAANEAQAEIERVKSNPYDLTQKIIAEANVDIGIIEGKIEKHDRAADSARNEQEQILLEFPEGIAPTTRDIKTIAIKVLLWAIVTLISSALLGLLVFGITKNYVFSIIVSPLFVVALEACSFWLSNLIERHKKELIGEMKFRISIGLTVTAVVVFCSFTCYFASVRADNESIVKRTRLENTIATLEADERESSLSDEESIQLASYKDQLKNLENDIERETVTFAVAECIAIPAELWLGMALLDFLSVRRTRRRYDAACEAEAANSEMAAQERTNLDVRRRETQRQIRDILWGAGVRADDIAPDNVANNPEVTDVDNLDVSVMDNTEVDLGVDPGIQTTDTATILDDVRMPDPDIIDIDTENEADFDEAGTNNGADL